MIFVTVGTQLPFDRLIRTVDAWAGRTGRRDILAQIGPSELHPQFIEYHPFLSPPEFTRHFSNAELVIAHAGMGSILSAMSLGKPILVIPRRAGLNEHRNDHQFATARCFKETGNILVALDEQELGAQLSRLESIPAASRIGLYASPELLAAVRAFLSNDERIS
ncbi:glycosyltransferase [Propionivibrio sp.]|uniref:glycosyltransferase n=1 Tax=Propionivibrio sp. TaxID=2212460 RepID=UPI003BF41B44